MAETTNTPLLSTEAAARLAAARAAEASAATTLTGLKAAKAAAYENIDREALAVLKPKIEETEDEIGIARAAVARAETELQTTLAREEQDRRRAAYQAAEATRAAVEEALLVRYPAHAYEIREIVRKRAEADALIEKVNLDLPENTNPIQRLSEQYFAYTHVPRKDLGSKTLDLWVKDYDGTVVPDEYQSRYIDQGGGKGISGSGRDSSTATKRKVKRTKYLPEIRRKHYEGFSNRLCLPGLANEQMYYEPAYNDAPIYVLSAIKAAEDLRESLKPPIRVPAYRDEILPEEALADA